MLRVIKSSEISLTSAIEEIFREMFQYEISLTVISEYMSGFGASRVFQVSVSHESGHEKLFVIKIAPKYWIEKEWSSYIHHVPTYLRGITEIRGEPVFGRGDLGGLCYPLVGGSNFKVENLLQYCLNAETNRIVADVLEDELYKNLQWFWAKGQLMSEYKLYRYYSHLLPFYLVIEETHSAVSNYRECNPNSIENEIFIKRDFVAIKDFIVSSIYTNNGTIALRPSNGTFGSYRILLKHLEDVTSYVIGQKIVSPITGVIIKTRVEELNEQVSYAFCESVNISKDKISTQNGIELPNPITILDEILNQPMTVRIASIHGDLRFENILVEYYEDGFQGPNHIAHLIDFDNSRYDHILRDHFRFETDVVTKLISKIFSEEGFTPETICHFYEQLHKVTVLGKTAEVPAELDKPFQMLISLRKLAQYYLYSPTDWTEYYRGLSIYLLGVLRFRELSLHVNGVSPKGVAFLCSAKVIQLLKRCKHQ